MTYLFASLVLFCTKYVLTQPNNVCKTFDDYYDHLQTNPNCYYNPDIDLSVPEIIQRHGYPVENYSVTTQDGYILTIFRIPYGNGSSNPKPRPPVFIQHGQGTNAANFVVIGRKSLAFVMADNGYDVWLGNFRGTIYSSTHLFLNDNDKRYWDFSFNELGIYDIPAQLDLVFNKTQQKMFYIGHSMGTTAYFVYNVEYPEKAKSRIRLAISMAPIAFLHDISTPFKLLTIPLITDIVKIFLDATTDGAIGQVTTESLAATKKLCLPYPVQMNLCALPSHVLNGFDHAQEDPTTLPVTTVQDNDAMSVKGLVHYAQLAHSGRFRKYDYGRQKNKEVYGTATPPQYNLSKINVPNYFIRGNNDRLATKQNVEKTFSALPPSTKRFGIYLVKYKKFDHNDFIMAKDVKQLLYDHIVTFLKVNGRKL